MNWLQLAQRTRQESSTGKSTDLAAVTGQTRLLKKIVDWVQDAYREVQEAHSNWLFLQTEFSFSTIASTGEYTPASVSLTDLIAWKKDTFRCYLSSVADEQFMDFYEWPYFRDIRLFSSNRTASGRPTEFSIKPNKTLSLWPIPDNVYTVVGEYFKAPVEFSDNDSSPLFPSTFHMVIVWRACMSLAIDQGNTLLYQSSERKYKKEMSKLENDQLAFCGERVSLI